MVHWDRLYIVITLHYADLCGSVYTLRRRLRYLAKKREAMIEGSESGKKGAWKEMERQRAKVEDKSWKGSGLNRDKERASGRR